MLASAYLSMQLVTAGGVANEGPKAFHHAQQ